MYRVSFRVPFFLLFFNEASSLARIGRTTFSLFVLSGGPTINPPIVSFLYLEGNAGFAYDQVWLFFLLLPRCMINDAEIDFQIRVLRRRHYPKFSLTFLVFRLKDLLALVHNMRKSMTQIISTLTLF